jgi:hypothetical protein
VRVLKVRCHHIHAPSSGSDAEGAEATRVDPQRLEQRRGVVDREDVRAAEPAVVLVDDGRGGLDGGGVEV